MHASSQNRGATLVSEGRERKNKNRRNDRKEIYMAIKL